LARGLPDSSLCQGDCHSRCFSCTDLPKQIWSAIFQFGFLSKEMFGKLDPVICNVFISRFQDDLLQNKIILADGKEAEIVYFRPNGSNMPVVRTVDNQIIDLSQQGFSAIHRVAVSF